MPSIFDALPGQETPVGSITKSLDRMWAAGESEGGKAIGDAKATQVNLVLHLGLKTTPEDAVTQFQTAVRFSRRYPCRVLVLCPIRDPEEAAKGELRAKIYGECHPGKTRGDLRCCEFVILSYPPDARLFLENQVSTCFSTDLPIYYWAHNFRSSSRLVAYQYLLSIAKRVLIDRALCPVEDPGVTRWPRPEVLRDLAYARLLPVRQTIGQFLSAHPPALLADGLREVAVRHGAARAAEARALGVWSRDRLLACGAGPDLPVRVEGDGAAPPESVVVCYHYTNDHEFCFHGDFAKACARLRAHFLGAGSELDTAIGLLAPEAALAEAMFF